MNPTTFNESPTVPTVPRPKWRFRHPKANHFVTLCMWGALGFVPGFFMLWAFHFMLVRHVAFTPFQAFAFLGVAITVLVFGFLLGTVVGLLTVITEKQNPEL